MLLRDIALQHRMVCSGKSLEDFIAEALLGSDQEGGTQALENEVEPQGTFMWCATLWLWTCFTPQEAFSKRSKFIWYNRLTQVIDMSLVQVGEMSQLVACWDAPRSRTLNGLPCLASDRFAKMSLGWNSRFTMNIFEDWCLYVCIFSLWTNKGNPCRSTRKRENHGQTQNACIWWLRACCTCCFGVQSVTAHLCVWPFPTSTLPVRKPGYPWQMWSCSGGVSTPCTCLKLANSNFQNSKRYSWEIFGNHGAFRTKIKCHAKVSPIQHEGQPWTSARSQVGSQRLIFNRLQIHPMMKPCHLVH